MEERIKLVLAALQMQGKHLTYLEVKQLLLTADAVKQLKGKFSIEDANHIKSLLQEEEAESRTKISY